MESMKDGWSSKKKVAALVGSILATRPTTVVEIGIWSGKSFIPQAMALKHIGDNKSCIVGIDPWSAVASVEGMDGDHKKWWGEVDHERVYKLFTDELVKTGVAPWTKIFRCRSDEWKIPNDFEIGILGVDGNHGEFASTYDVTHFAPLVSLGGFVWMDDIKWASKATAMLPVLGFKPLFDEDGGTFYQRITKP